MGMKQNCASGSASTAAVVASMTRSARAGFTPVNARPMIGRSVSRPARCSASRPASASRGCIQADRSGSTPALTPRASRTAADARSRTWTDVAARMRSGTRTRAEPERWSSRSTPTTHTLLPSAAARRPKAGSSRPIRPMSRPNRPPPPMTTERCWRRAGTAWSMPIDRTPCRADVSPGERETTVTAWPSSRVEEAAQDRLVPDVAVAVGADHQDGAAQPVPDDAHRTEAAISRTRTLYGPTLRPRGSQASSRRLTRSCEGGVEPARAARRGRRAPPATCAGSSSPRPTDALPAVSAVTSTSMPAVARRCEPAVRRSVGAQATPQGGRPNLRHRAVRHRRMRQARSSPRWPRGPSRSSWNRPAA